MQRRQRSWNDVRGLGFLIAVSVAMTASLATFAVHTGMSGKAPGESNCYKDVCHRVYTLDETRRMIGQSVELHATHYDDPSVDKMNTGELTSSGEVFDATNPARTSASNYPDGTELLLWSPLTKRASHVRVNDFGPFWGKRTIDVTRRVADDLGFAKSGVTQLRVMVIWVPPAQAAKYKKYRSYPMSFGLLGVVEHDQLEPLARRLIATADHRNRELMPRPMEPPDFATEAAMIAAAEAALTPRRVAELMNSLPRVDLGAPPVDLYRRVYSGPPGLRAEAVVDEPVARAQATERLASLLRTMSPVALPDVPSELRPPVVLASASDAKSVGAHVAQAGPTPANRSSGSQQSEVVADAPRQSVAGEPRQPALQTERAPIVGPADQPVSVSVALARRQLDFGQGGLSLWIGIAVMLTTFLGVAGLARRFKRAPVPVAPPGVSTSRTQSHSGQDALAIARHAAARAEADARELLAHEKASRDVASLAEAQARDELAREISRREADREAQMRVRLEVAAEAQADAMRELDAIDAARRARAAAAVMIAPAPSIPAPAAPAAPATQSQPVSSRAPATAQRDAVPFSSPSFRTEIVARAEPPRAPKPVIVEPPPAVFPGVSDPKLAAAILGRPGAQTYWGNTIIAQARLDGTARSGSPLRIDGVVEGACYAPVILVAEGATVTGVLAADTIIVLGTVRGILSGRKVTVAKSAEVEGEIYYQSMSIDPQAQCDVRFRRLAGDADPVTVGATVFDAHQADRSRAA